MSRIPLLPSAVLLGVLLTLISFNPQAQSCTLVNAFTPTGSFATGDFIVLTGHLDNTETACNNTFTVKYEVKKCTSCDGTNGATFYVWGANLNLTYEVRTVTTGSPYDCIELCACQ